MNTKSLFKISDLTKEEIFEILHDANAFSCSHKDWQLPERKLVANLFFEPSTRTDVYKRQALVWTRSYTRKSWYLAGCLLLF